MVDTRKAHIDVQYVALMHLKCIYICTVCSTHTRKVACRASYITSIRAQNDKLFNYMCYFCDLFMNIVLVISRHCSPVTTLRQYFKLGRTHEKQWIRISESTSAKREWIWIYESTAFECVLQLNTPQTNRHFLWLGLL